MEYYSTSERNRPLLSATTWTNLRNSDPSERNQMLKITECMTAFTRKCPEKVNLESLQEEDLWWPVADRRMKSDAS